MLAPPSSGLQLGDAVSAAGPLRLGSPAAPDPGEDLLVAVTPLQRGPGAGACPRERPAPIVGRPPHVTNPEELPHADRAEHPDAEPEPR